MLRKLAESGLETKAQVLGLSELPSHEVQALGLAPGRAMRIPYYDPRDGSPLPDAPGAEPFYRLRYLDRQGGQDGAKYVQARGTLPVAYYPPIIAWEPVLQNPDIPLIITEGELKAAKATLDGFPTIGLGGVYSFRAQKRGIEWLSSLGFPVWVHRSVYIVFDSDMAENKNIQKACLALCAELTARGAEPYVVLLPAIENLKKTGLDDFLVHAPNAKEQLQSILHQAPPFGLSRPLYELNAKYTLVKDPGLVVETDQAKLTRISLQTFKDAVCSNLYYTEMEFGAKGPVFKRKPVAQAWLQWPMRQEHSSLTYAPGRPTTLPDGSLNIWPGFAIDPAPSATPETYEPWTKLLSHLFHGEPEALRWFLQWCAYPLQYPGTKLATAAVIHGVRHGTGKSLIGYTLGRIYGRNFTELGQQDLHASFNDWVACKQLVMGDDITGTNVRKDADMLKRMITQREVRINQKYMPTYVVPDCVNYLFTANHPDAFFLEDDDRRFFIHEVPVPPLDDDFYVEYDLWLHGDGPKYLFRYLLDLDTEDFNPKSRALQTSAKARMIGNVQSDLASWVRALLATPGPIMEHTPLGVRDLYTSAELLLAYDPGQSTRTTANGMAREMARAGVPYAYKGMAVRMPDGRQKRFLIVANQERWLKATAAEIVEYLSTLKSRY